MAAVGIQRVMLPAFSRGQTSTITIAVLVPMLFLMPFGELPRAVMGGLSVQQVIIPLAVAVIAMFAADRFTFHPATALLLAFVLLTTTSLMTSTQYMTVFGSMVGAFLIVCVVSNGVRSFRDLELVLRAYLFGMAIVTVIVAVAIAGGPDFGLFLSHPFVRKGWFIIPFVQGTESNTTSFGVFFVAGIPIALNELVRVRSYFLKTALGLLLLLMVAESLIVFARASLIGTAIALVCFTNYTLSRRGKIILVMVGLAAALAVSATLAFLDSQQHVSTNIVIRGINALLNNKERSGSIHATILQGAINLAVSVPPWGVGSSNMPEKMRALTGYDLYAHNAYLTIWVEYGLFAVLAFVAFYVTCVFEAWSAAHGEADPWRRNTYATVLGIAAGLTVSSMFHDDYVNSMIWTFFGLALACGPASAASRAMIRLVPIGPAPGDGVRAIKP